jgi:hypothetical protein
MNQARMVVKFHDTSFKNFINKAHQSLKAVQIKSFIILFLICSFIKII